jgi:hypothetical protein
MKILLIGFQRSGTTLLRRLVTMHPDVRTIMHEQFLLYQCRDKASVVSYLQSRNIDFKKENWGDKTPYYPNIRRIPVAKYCETWTDYFGKKESKILNIYRHPYDIAFSVDSKYRGQTFVKATSIYKKSILRTLRETIDMPNVMSFKYEELILNPDKMIPKIYKFCGLNNKVKFRKLMKRWENSKYQSFDESRVFAYKGKKIPKFKGDISNILSELNDKLDGPEYNVK